MPASAGEHGPGERMMWLGASASTSSERDRVVAADDRFAAQLADVPREVVDEGIVVVDEENHSGVRSASIMPRALSSVSRYSCSGSESATIPPPALKYTRPACATAVRIAMLRVERAGQAPVADRAAVHAPLRRLELGDDFHRAHFRRAGDRPAGKRRAQQVERVCTRREVADDRRDEVVDRGVVLEREQLRHAHACPARRRARGRCASGPRSSGSRRDPWRSRSAPGRARRRARDRRRAGACP